MLAGGRIRLRSAAQLIQCAWEASGVHAASRCQCSVSFDALPGQRRLFAAQAEEVSTNADVLAAEGAKELGLDRAELGWLKERSEQALPDAEHTELYTDIPNRKKLTWGDIPAAVETLGSFHDANAPSAPVYDVGEWVGNHYPEFGYNARSPFYQWKQWAEAHLPAEEVETYKAMDTLMADDKQRSAVLKTAQFELARLWDWQHRRAELGLPYDLPESSSTSSSSRQGAANAIGTPDQKGAAAVSAASTVAPASAGKNDATTHAGSTTAAADAAAPEAADPFSGKALKDVMAQEGAFSPGPILGTRPPATAGAATAGSTVDGGLGWGLGSRLTPEQEEALQQERIEKRMSPKLARDALASVRDKLDEGRYQERHGRPRELEATLQQQTFVEQSADVDSLFTPAKLPADEAAVAALPQLSHDVLEAQARGVQRWGDLPLLDRTGLHKAMLSEFMEASAHKFRPRKPKWSLADDGYTFDLNTRPPTATLQLLTDYLELKYADALLKRDAVESLRRRTHALNLAALGSEAAELPPLALTRPVTLSAPERHSVTAALDAAFEQDPGGSYKALVEKLYADGLVTADEMAQCCSAADRRAAGLAAGSSASAAAAEDRDRLFATISGVEQRPQPADDAAQQARSAWEAAAEKLQGSWAISMWPFAHGATGGSGSSSAKQSKDASSNVHSAIITDAASADAGKTSGDGADDDVAGPGLDQEWWQQPLSFEEAQQQWEHLQHLAASSTTAAAATSAGAAGGAGIPSLQELLAAEAAWRQGSMHNSELQSLQRRLAPLQRLLAGDRRPGDVDVSSGEQLQQLFALPPTLGEAVGMCVREVMLRHQLPSKRPKQGSSLSWSDLYSVMWKLHQSSHDKHHKIGYPDQQEQQQQSQQGHLQEQQQQQQHPRRSELGSAAAVAGDLDVAEAHEVHLRELAVTLVTTPPYPGARKIVRFEQNLVLAAQPLARMQHKAALRVHAGELMEEARLSEQALQHIIRVCGKRYNPDTGEIRIVCDRFPSREENRRWCLEALHRLLDEGNRRHPSAGFLFAQEGAAGKSAFALQ